MKILMKIPTRRPKKALEVIQGYHALASGKHEVKWLVSIDDDDAPTQAMREKFKEIGCEVRSGRSISKIHAGNRDVSAFDLWFDIVVLTADDMICKEKDWDDIIATDMRKHFPDLDGVLHYNDGHRGQGLNTLPIMGRVCWASCGYFYHESYISLFADDEFTRTHKSVYIDRVIIDHQHPVWTGERRDDLLKFTESLAGIDKRTYERRKAAGFPKEIPDLTIGICTVPGREVKLECLMSILREQVKDAGEGKVEIIIEHDDGSEHTGTKRQKILDKANGRFVSFIDDDDLVSIHYVSRILASIEANPYQDAIGFTGRMTTNGVDPRTFVHELTGNPEWRTEGLVYYRTPGHLNPVRIDLARRTGFKAMTYGEDMRYCKELFPLLKVSEMLWGDPMYFYLYEPKQSEASKRKNKPTPDGHGEAATVTAEPKQELRARPRKAGIRM